MAMPGEDPALTKPDALTEELLSELLASEEETAPDKQIIGFLFDKSSVVLLKLD